MTSKRDISSANESALLAGNVNMSLAIRLDFASGVKRYQTEIGDETLTHPIHGAEVYKGIGDFGGLASDVVESVSSASQKLVLAITALKSALINDVLTDDYVNREIELMVVLFDESWSQIDDPEILFSGFMENVDMVLGKERGTMSVTCYDQNAIGQRASDLRFTDEDKQRESSGDLFGEYIYRMADLQLQWGGRVITGGGVGGGSGENNTRIQLR